MLCGRPVAATPAAPHLALPLAAALLGVRATYSGPGIAPVPRRRTGRTSFSATSTRLDASWGAVVGLERGRRRGLLRADELILADSRISAVDGPGRKTTLPHGLLGHPATHQVQVNLYDRDWASGAIGEHLKAKA